jgi:Raf kinase inhibitor-like YbhB/YbcL family protein
MSSLTDVGRRIARALRFVRSDDDQLVSRVLVPHLAPTLEVTSPDFGDGGALPFSATAQGGDVPPVLVVKKVPADARALVLVCETPDAPTLAPFIHWIVFRLPGRDLTIDAQAVAAAEQGRNSRLHVGWAPIDPLPGHGAHRYHFEVFALGSHLPGAADEQYTMLTPYQEPLGVEAGAGRAEVVESMRGRVVAWGELVGTYER